MYNPEHTQDHHTKYPESNPRTTQFIRHYATQGPGESASINITR